MEEIRLVSLNNRFVNPTLSKNPLQTVKGFFIKQIYKPDPVSKHNVLILIIYLRLLLPAYFSCLPSSIARARSNTSLHDIAPHRVYLVSLQHDLYILSVALFLTSRWMAVNHYDYTMVSGLSSHPIKVCAIRRITLVQTYN